MHRSQGRIQDFKLGGGALKKNCAPPPPGSAPGSIYENKMEYLKHLNCIFEHVKVNRVKLTQLDTLVFNISLINISHMQGRLNTIIGPGNSPFVIIKINTNSVHYLK
jgi:hypothetical protein